MRTLSNSTSGFTPVPVTSITVAIRERYQRNKQIVSAVLLVIVLFQLGDRVGHGPGDGLLKNHMPGYIHEHNPSI